MNLITILLTLSVACIQIIPCSANPIINTLKSTSELCYQQGSLPVFAAINASGALAFAAAAKYVYGKKLTQIELKKLAIQVKKNPKNYKLLLAITTAWAGLNANFVGQKVVATFFTHQEQKQNSKKSTESKQGQGQKKQPENQLVKTAAQLKLEQERKTDTQTNQAPKQEEQSGNQPKEETAKPKTEEEKELELEQKRIAKFEQTVTNAKEKVLAASKERIEEGLKAALDGKHAMSIQLLRANTLENNVRESGIYTILSEEEKEQANTLFAQRLEQIKKHIEATLRSGSLSGDNDLKNLNLSQPEEEELKTRIATELKIREENLEQAKKELLATNQALQALGVVTEKADKTFRATTNTEYQERLEIDLNRKEEELLHEIEANTEKHKQTQIAIKKDELFIQNIKLRKALLENGVASAEKLLALERQKPNPEPNNIEFYENFHREEAEKLNTFIANEKSFKDLFENRVTEFNAQRYCQANIEAYGELSPEDKKAVDEAWDIVIEINRDVLLLMRERKYAQSDELKVQKEGDFERAHGILCDKLGIAKLEILN